MIRTPENENRIVVGITHGDINSISYEVIIKTFLDTRITELFTPVVYGLSKAASYHRKTLNIPDFSFNVIRHADQANPKRPNLVNLHDQEVKIDLGISSQAAGEMAIQSLNAAIDDLKKGHIDVLVTAPVNKNNIAQYLNAPFTGHTEYLASKFDATDPLMLMVHDKLRIGVATSHIALSKVPQKITTELVINKIHKMEASLKRDFAIGKPRIAVLGLNPHAGDGGLLGNEEQTVIVPAIEKVYSKGTLAFGPYPADGFFANDAFRSFDGILAMYHDQGLIPFKALAAGEGVNFTAGMPFIRTSPAHGTAYDIAGKDIASPDSMRAAIYLACDIFNNRRMWEELNHNPLPITQFEKEN